MNRNEYMTAFANALGSVPLEERRKALEYYNEYFDDAVEAGKNEEDVCASLDPPLDAAKLVIAESRVYTASVKPSPKNASKAIIAVISVLSLPVAIPVALVCLVLGICAVAFVIAIVATIVSIILALIAAIIAFAVLAVVLLVNGGAGFELSLLLYGAILMGAGASCFIVTGLIYLLKAIFKGIARFFRFIGGKFSKRKVGV